MTSFLPKSLKVPVLVAENPMDCVAVGTGVMLDNMDKLPKRKLSLIRSLILFENEVFLCEML